MGGHSKETVSTGHGTKKVTGSNLKEAVGGETVEKVKRKSLIEQTRDLTRDIGTSSTSLSETLKRRSRQPAQRC